MHLVAVSVAAGVPVSVSSSTVLSCFSQVTDLSCSNSKPLLKLRLHGRHSSLPIPPCGTRPAMQYAQVRFMGRRRIHYRKHVTSNLACNSDVACSHHSFLLPWILHRRSSCLSCFFLTSWRRKKSRVAFCRMIDKPVNFRYDASIFVSRFMVGAILFVSLSIAVSNGASFALSEENLLFLEAWRTIDRAYVDKTFNGQSWFRYRENALHNEPMNTREETYIAIKKMVSTLDDPFTRFLEPERLRNLRSGTQSSLTGVGLSVGYPLELEGSSAGLVVVSAAPGGPASRAGILSGDMVLAIDDMSTEHMSIYEAADRMQGPKGSSVELTVRSGPEIKHVALMRERVLLNPVKSRLCEIAGSGKESARVGYIKLTSFSKNASGTVKEAIENMKSNNVNAFILDLRDNGGGLFPEGVEIAKFWLDKGVIVYICDSRGVRDIYDTDGSNAIAASEPLVVLVNKGTASASEVLAGALKDNKRAVLFGEPTFGKGEIQSVFELSDGSGLAVTVARYETPAHRDINKVGVIPDYPLPESFPKDENELCNCLQDPAAACYLNKVPLFPR